MFKYLLQRLATIVPTLAFVSILIFGLQQLLPGDPAIALAGEQSDPETIRYLRQKFHLDEPLPVRYWYWLSGVLHGDLGDSVRIQKPVSDLILEKLPVTIQLAAMAMAIALVIGITAGVVSAVKKDTWLDYAANVFALWGLSTPNFWLGILLILLFAVELGWLPASGYVSPFEDLRGNLASMIMPAFVLGNAIAAVLMRHTRSAMLQVMQSDYVRTARAKGLSERDVLWRHVLRNAMIPVMTVMGLQFANLLAGTIVIENVFYLPGLGRLIFQSIANRDLIVVRNCVMLLAAVVVIVNFVVDVLYAFIDPRIKVHNL
jgi:peptide/nickel transport system permease protein